MIQSLLLVHWRHYVFDVVLLLLLCMTSVRTSSSHSSFGIPLPRYCSTLTWLGSWLYCRAAQSDSNVFAAELPYEIRRWYKTCYLSWLKSTYCSWTHWPLCFWTLKIGYFFSSTKANRMVASISMSGGIFVTAVCTKSGSIAMISFRRRQVIYLWYQFHMLLLTLRIEKYTYCTGNI